MADYSRSEKQSIKDSAKSLKKYGSTCNHFKRPERYISHVIQKSDTLQGLALKYNTTTEQIRRVNRLYASDSLFLRDSLKIPVVNDGVNSFSNSDHSNSGSTSETITSSISADSFTDDEDKSVQDFLGKIDSAIATTRAQVKHVQANSSFADPTDPAVMMQKHKSKRNSHTGSTCNDVFATPHPVVLSQSRKVRSSLQRLEREQDELFEL